VFIENHRYLVLNFGPRAERCAPDFSIFHFSKFQNSKSGRGSVSIFSRIKKSSGDEDSATGQCEARAFNKLARTFAAQVETLKSDTGAAEVIELVRSEGLD
jgi:hypothetical protein